jgi:hypothetical protein
MLKKLSKYLFLEAFSPNLEIKKILILQYKKTKHVRKAHNAKIVGNSIFSMIYKGTLPITPMIGEEINAALKSFFFIETNLEIQTEY